MLQTTITILAANIIQWGVDRNIIGGATAQKQFLKLMSEFGELGDSIAKNDIEGIKDGIGDSFVVLTIIAGILGLNTFFMSALSLSADPKMLGYRFANKSSDVESFYALTSDKMTYIGIKLLGEKEGHHSIYTDAALLNAVAHLSYIASLYELTMEVCVLHAYNEIKDRKGVLFNGTFIKSTDARYDDAMSQIAAARESVA